MSKINGGAMMNPRKRFSFEEKFSIILESFTNEISVQDICRKYGISQTIFYKWRDQFLEGAKKGLMNRRDQRQTNPDKARIEELEKLVGRKTLEIEVLKKTLKLI